MTGNTFTLHIQDDAGKAIPVRVTRKRIKNLNLRITSNGEVHVSVPLRTSEASAAAFIERKRGWVLDRLRRHRECAATGPGTEPLSAPSIVPVWGQPMRLDAALAHDFESPFPAPRQTTFASFIGAPEPAARPAKVHVSDLSACSPEELQQQLQELYRSEVAAALPGLIRSYELKMDVSVSRVTVRSMKTRWGSCTPATGAIRIALQLGAYPPACLDMVVAHELVHLLEPSHGPRFHMLLDSYCPGNRELSRRLREPAIDRSAQP